MAGRKAAVTGASRGIGRAIALALAAAGADVGLVARSLSDLEKVADEVRALGRTAVVAHMDVTDADSVNGAVDDVHRRLGGLDVMVNNSGVVSAGHALDTTLAEWDRVLDTNLRGTFVCCQAAGRHLTAQGAGKVINVASHFGLMAVPGFSAYCASKAAILHLTRVLAIEWARHGVQVNAIAPGYVETDLSADVRENPELKDRVLQRIPARRMADAAEIGPLAVLLASSQSDYMTGSVLVIDGGQSI
ncbi:2-deoxy-D-gluconate 3-dehydrogenase [Mycolicibacterium pulveris]|uniref:2-deoxy-D-gluconate 3-dehydrogenase n=1 Tax=Mycolicibacterium pulveris TaxID=36813 RepID=A0A7I7UQJ8_MYCPV|nr:2-deoxy-D-gluconate 3-dehydrogenase [Mycolicibacterium pulveris]